MNDSSVRARLETALANVAAANELAFNYERQLQALSVAESHPRWSVGGELVLIGDRGRFADGTDGTVIGINGQQAIVWDEDELLDRSFAECAELLGRSRLPRPD